MNYDSITATADAVNAWTAATSNTWTARSPISWATTAAASVRYAEAEDLNKLEQKVINIMYSLIDQLERKIHKFLVDNNYVDVSYEEFLKLLDEQD